MYVTDLIRSRHQSVRSSLAAYVDAGDRIKKLGDWRQLKRLILDEFRFKEEVLYPALMKMRSLKARAFVRQALADQHLLDGLVVELDQLDEDDPRFASSLREFAARIRQRLREEEEMLLPDMEARLSASRLEALAQRLARHA